MRTQGADMALADNASTVAAKFASLSIARQIGLLTGLAASIAIGLAVAMWSRDPDYVPLYSQLNPRDSSDIIAALERNGIAFTVDKAHGALMVAAQDLHSARFKLAAEGLPRESRSDDAFGGSSAFNTSQFMENARYKQTLESELARTISKFNDIKSARVHLAIPRESAFVRDNQPPSASVFIDAYSAMELKKHTIAAIVNLVASSIPNLDASHVTVVNQDGQLLNEGGGQTFFTNTDRYLDYRQSLEHQYAQKIQDILTPMLGFGRVRAKVSADIDFTAYEQTKEQFNSERPSLRSEQKMEEKHATPPAASGVPGTLSNTPPANAAAAANQKGNAPPDNTQTSQSSDSRSQSTKNFELDKTISHTKNQPGTIKRISVAVLVDNPSDMDEKTKKLVQKPLTPKDIDQIKLLVTDAIGLDTKRGDSLNVINSNFVKPAPIPALPEEKFWQKNWFWSIVKQSAGAIFILALLFGVLRPMLKTIASNKNIPLEGEEGPNGLTYSGATMVERDDFETKLSLLRQIVDKEPTRVAQVVKSWVDKG